MNPAFNDCRPRDANCQLAFNARNLRIKIIDRAVAICDVEIVSHVRLIIERNDVADARRHLERLQLHMMHHKSMLGGMRCVDCDQNKEGGTNRL